MTCTGTQYAEILYLTRVGLKASLIERLGDCVLNEALESRSRFADSYLGNRYTLPLTAWSDDLRLAVAQLAAWDLMSSMVGFDPEAAQNTIWRDRRDEALQWLANVGSGKATPAGIVDSSLSTPPASGGFSLRSQPLRGWWR